MKERLEGSREEFKGLIAENPLILEGVTSEQLDLVLSRLDPGFRYVLLSSCLRLRALA